MLLRVESPHGLERHSRTSIYLSDESTERASGAAEKTLRGAKRPGRPQPSPVRSVNECYRDVSPISLLNRATCIPAAQNGPAVDGLMDYDGGDGANAVI